MVNRMPDGNICNVLWLNNDPSYEVDETRMIVLQCRDRKTQELRDDIGITLMEFADQEAKDDFLMRGEVFQNTLNEFAKGTKGDVVYIPVGGHHISKLPNVD